MKRRARVLTDMPSGSRLELWLNDLLNENGISTWARSATYPEISEEKFYKNYRHWSDEFRKLTDICIVDPPKIAIEVTYQSKLWDNCLVYPKWKIKEMYGLNAKKWIDKEYISDYLFIWGVGSDLDPYCPKKVYFDRLLGFLEKGKEQFFSFFKDNQHQLVIDPKDTLGEFCDPVTRKLSENALKIIKRD